MGEAEEEVEDDIVGVVESWEESKICDVRDVGGDASDSPKII